MESVKYFRTRLTHDEFGKNYSFPQINKKYSYQSIVKTSLGYRVLRSEYSYSCDLPPSLIRDEDVDRYPASEDISSEDEYVAKKEIYKPPWKRYPQSVFDKKWLVEIKKTPEVLYRKRGDYFIKTRSLRNGLKYYYSMIKSGIEVKTSLLRFIYFQGLLVYRKLLKPEDLAIAIDLEYIIYNILSYRSIIEKGHPIKRLRCF